MAGSYDKVNTLQASRDAIGKVRDASVRDDLLRFIGGAEICLANGEVVVALDCVRTVVTTVVALSRTLTPEVAVQVLDGLLEDSEERAVMLRRGLGFSKSEMPSATLSPALPSARARVFRSLTARAIRWAAELVVVGPRDFSSSGRFWRSKGSVQRVRHRRCERAWAKGQSTILEGGLVIRKPALTSRR